LDPINRKKKREKKQAKNLSRMGFKITINKRYRIDDGRIGIAKFCGRTLFGKAHEDWVGIMVEHGKGEHNGTIDGKQYFRCAQGKGIMVRPQNIIEEIGDSGQRLTEKIIKGSKEMRELMEDIAFKKEQQLIYG